MSMPEQHETAPETPQSSIDLAAVTTNWISTEGVTKRAAELQAPLDNQASWISEHQEQIDRLLQRPEWADKTAADVVHLRREQLQRMPERVTTVEQRLIAEMPTILETVRQRLGRWLPDWVAPETEVRLGLFERADFRIDGSHIFVDLGRLATNPNPIDLVTEGMTHELVHRWMDEKQTEELTDPHQWLRRKLVNEGLAVFISGQSLAAHHTTQDKPYESYRAESIEKVHQLLARGTDLTSEECHQVFRNLGPGYIAGEAMIQSALFTLGEEEFRTRLAQAPEHPEQLVVQNT